jgi:mutator protein MutT
MVPAGAATGAPMSDIVNAVLLKNGRVLLAKRSAARASYPNRWSFPGGHVEAGEGLERALAREMDEEIGVRPEAFRKLAVIADPADARIAYHMYAVTRWRGGEPRLIGAEHSELCWVDLAPDRLKPNRLET